MKKISLFLLLFFIVVTTAHADLICGKTYPIVEPDMLAELQRRGYALAHNKQKMTAVVNKLKKEAEHYSPAYIERSYLFPSQKSYTYYHDVIYTLPFNIPKVVDGRVVGILYPKGFTFHVLKYIPYNFPTLVIFDIKNKLQREYILKKYSKNYLDYFISVDGNLLDLLKFAKNLKHPVYFNLPEFNKRFGLRNTISIVRRSKRYRDDVVVRVIGMKEIEKFLKPKNR
jgi:hypothetical protein